MRKTYEKPALYAESFGLLEHIAACRVEGMGTEGVHATFKSGAIDSGCTFVDSNLVLYINPDICDMDLFDDPQHPNVEELGVECYNAFSSASTLFSS